MLADQRSMDEKRHDKEPPFVFGVSGHRDLVAADEPELRRQVDKVFGAFGAAYRDRRFQLLSPLAEGADRLAAEVALARGISLLVPMPMAQADYERDFASPTSLEEFRRLLASSEASWEVNEKDDAPDSGMSGSKGRDGKYAAVGDYIARMSHVLILLWDGRQNEKLGGTGWVKMRRDYWAKRAPTGPSVPGPPGYLPTIHIVTPREANTEKGQTKPRIELIGTLPEASD